MTNRIPRGELTHVITIQQVTESQDGFGEPDASYSTFLTTRAKRETLWGREFYQSQRVNAEVTDRFTMDYRSGVTNKMRIVEGSETFDIFWINNMHGMNETLQIDCIKRS